jgi:hypothetical protein
MSRNLRATSARSLVANQLIRLGYVTEIKPATAPNTNILCSNVEQTKSVHIIVATYRPGKGTCSVGLKAEKDFGDNFFWVLAGISSDGSAGAAECFVIPSTVLAKNVSLGHQRWLADPGKRGQRRKDSTVRTVHLPPKKNYIGWSIDEYRDRWNLIKKRLESH